MLLRACGLSVHDCNKQLGAANGPRCLAQTVHFQEDAKAFGAKVQVFVAQCSPPPFSNFFGEGVPFKFNQTKRDALCFP